MFGKIGFDIYEKSAVLVDTSLSTDEDVVSGYIAYIPVPGPMTLDRVLVPGASVSETSKSPRQRGCLP